ncbi:MAG: efflux transporter outer membrane subunit [Chlorobiaceae bacterium]|nr:efflux transporter outer membrane subunit [Chlorobiaceae bacterium]
MKGIVSRIISLATLALGCGLTACSPVREYQRPEVQLPAAYPAPVAPGKEMAIVPYRKFFTDPDLVSLIDSAVENNHDLLIAIRNIDYAREAYDVSRLGFLPDANLGGSASYSRASENSSTAMNNQKRSSRSYTAALTVSWEADIWAKLQNRKKAALAEYLRSADAARAVRTRLVSSVAQGYWNLQMLDSQLDITRHNIALADTTLTMMRLQYDAGNVTSLAVQQQESQLFSAKLAISKLEAARSAQQNALSILAGRMPGSVVKRGKAESSPAVSDSLGAGVPLGLLSNRPDVKAAEESLMQKHASMGAAKAMLYPSLTVTAQGGLNAIESSRWFSTPGSLFDSVQGGLLQPIFRRGELKAGYEQSKIVRDQAELAFRQTLLKAVGEVSDALVQVEQTGTQQRLATQRAATLRQAAANSRLLFQSGMATWLEVIISESTQLQSELELADVRRSHLSALADLYRSVGGGWQE